MSAEIIQLSERHAPGVTLRAWTEEEVLKRFFSVFEPGLGTIALWRKLRRAGYDRRAIMTILSILQRRQAQRSAS